MQWYTCIVIQVNFIGFYVKSKSQCFYQKYKNIYHLGLFCIYHLGLFCISIKIVRWENSLRIKLYWQIIRIKVALLGNYMLVLTRSVCINLSLKISLYNLHKMCSFKPIVVLWNIWWQKSSFIRGTLSIIVNRNF